ncbi:PQQ-dependent sugar dehydrogenase [Streptomyces sp. TRM 70351]|uniref:PQQ-dependent sugar dehydrogenase n=1 Tax=Streptomyces sp. TRM 70351 TaxID=3116552 RepID=UPI002E7B749C|nr:PQQ-dependent sugar dehydrogenase [Streptomyces sp. TRM 70351]MEE1929738.1 PQQ-dependent sugar dehydrogenase [Streptomyces sp. TRM 70351]
MHRRFRQFLAATAGALLVAAGTYSTSAAAPTAVAHHPTPTAADFQQVTLAKGEPETGEPMTLAVLPDRSVLHTSRDGTVRITDAAGNTKVSGRLPVYRHDEEGLQGVGVDPGFADNRFVYLYYAPQLDTPDGDAPSSGSAADFAPFEGVNRLSRFHLRTDGTLDLASERKVLDVPATRGICCHVGGDIAFDAEGNLYLSTGDDSNPFASDGYTPIDERADRNPSYDAQRSSGNTDDLRGKVLRIKVGADGGYSIPEGNLFAPGTANTRPEIYAMGFRNPFRMSVDQATGVVYLGDYGPDAGTANPGRGPSGKVEFNRITGPGNFGWPYCHGDNDAYTDYDFATQSSGQRFDCAAPRNTSPRNTGLTELPPAQAAWITYDGGSVPEFGTGSESPMGGPVYRYDAALDSDVKFPAAYDGVFFAGEFGRQWIRTIEFDGANGDVHAIQEFPWSGTQVMDMEFGPDGALYVLDYGKGYFAGDENSALYRIEATSDGQSPVAEATATPTSGAAPLAVRFSSAGTSDPEGDALSYAWDFGDGGTSTAANPSHTYTRDGQYTATLTVTDATGRTGTASVRITVGNTAPTVELKLPHDGQIVDFGSAVPFEVEVSDPEDGQIDCSKVKVTFIIGHDNHGHPQTSGTGCSGTIQTRADGEHDPNANIFGVWDAEYTDAGGMTTHDQRITQTAHRQAEHYGDSSGVQVVDHAPAHGGKTVGHIENGDWIAFTPYHLADATEFTARVSSGGSGGTLEVRAGSPTGALLGSVDVPVTGGWETFEEVSTPLSGQPSSTTELHLVFKGGSGSLFDVDEFAFTTGGGGPGPGPEPGTGAITGIGGKCVDVRDGSSGNGTQIQLWDCNNSAAQTWTVPGDGTLRALGKCLDISGGGTANGTKIQLWDCNGTGAQTWTHQDDNTLRNPQSAKCLDAEGISSANGTRLHLWTCHGNTNQQWNLPS